MRDKGSLRAVIIALEAQWLGRNSERVVLTSAGDLWHRVNGHWRLVRQDCGAEQAEHYITLLGQPRLRVGERSGLVGVLSVRYHSLFRLATKSLTPLLSLGRWVRLKDRA